MHFASNLRRIPSNRFGERRSPVLSHSLWICVFFTILVGAHSYCAIAAAKPASAAPTLEAALVESTAPSGTTAAPRQASGSRDIPITWFGYVDEDSNAVVGETWTFDHDGPDPYEGWVELTVEELTTWRHINATIWDGHGNPDTPPIINGDGSAWVGCFQDKADSLGWVAGLGYGNEWCYRFESPSFTWDGEGDIVLSFNYWVDLEYYCDYLRVYLRSATADEEVLLDEFTGICGDYSSPEFFGYVLSESEFSAIGGNEATLVFELNSDWSWSDEDGLYATVYGPFAVDDIALTDHVSGGDILYTFDTDDEGFVSSNCPGSWWSASGIASVDDYDIECDPCPLSGNVLHMHDENQEHPDRQYTMMISPAAALPEEECFVFAQYDMFITLPREDGVWYRLGWMYTMDGTAWSERVGSPTWCYSPGPSCGRGFSYASGYVPANALAVKLVIELMSSCESFGIPPEICTGESNASPLYDNIRIGAIAPDALVVGCGSYPNVYPTIQAAIDATDLNNTDILVWNGAYSGDGNHSLHFDEVPTNPVRLYSLNGPESTILDGTGETAWAILMTSDASTQEVLVDGFTVNNFTDGGGGGLYADQQSRPVVLSNCVFSSNYAGVDIREPSITMSWCKVHGNQADGCFFEGAFDLTNCTIAHNGNRGVRTYGPDATGQIDHTIIWGNDTDLYVSDTSGDIAVRHSAVDLTKVDDPGGLYDWGDPDENVYIDPFFCGPEPPGMTTAGDYRLDWVSPCLAAYSPSGELIGAYGQGCSNGYIADTPEGYDVVIHLDENVTMTFDHVIDAGDTRELTREDGPEVPSEYHLVPSDPAIFYYLTTTAEYDGNITTCIHYDEGAVSEEENLKLLHFDSSADPPGWVDITTSIDTEEDIICGVSATLSSPFVVAELVASAVSEDIKGTPLKVSQNYPNPARGTTAITYQIPMAAEVTAKIYNVDGRLVRVLIEGEAQKAGRHQIRWDGRDDQGNLAESGFYFYQLQAGELVERRQMLLVR